MNFRFGQRVGQAPRADFEYFVDHVDGRRILKIVDLDLGNMSVTNDIEQVLAAVFARMSNTEPFHPQELAILYRDSEGTWDRVLLEPQTEADSWRVTFGPGPGREELSKGWGIAGNVWR